ncbi:MAG: flavodoxin-dependent (E)-4-hydroxy-3-methylbut-2-enyl-diphosphate synthase [Candidatus Izimaplasma sp.]|nr:flavodoxin-dependent (E)-4-hydroxy-3-methylbut-2-enyl-diphosphate synthase [Candidatus Izimaplasma bacterium]
MKRTNTKKIMVGNIQIGHQDHVVIQTMTNTKTKDINKTIKQINTLATAGAEIVRLAVLDEADALALKEIKARVTVPLVADIHFDYKLALKAIETGVDKIRINPGNIGDKSRVKQVVDACKKEKIPIRIGVNAGSLKKDILKKYGKTAQAMLASIDEHIRLLEALDFRDIVLSLKASDVRLTVEAYKQASELYPYPLHLGITEAGPKFSGTIKSSVGLGILLYEGIGDTIRVSLSTDPLEEVKVAKELLASLDLYKKPNIVSCPTCGRLDYDMFKLVNQVEDYLETLDTNITVAVMGCAVNGPGEARSADIGVAGGKKEGLIFVDGEILRKVPQAMLFETLKAEIMNYIKNKENN